MGLRRRIAVTTLSGLAVVALTVFALLQWEISRSLAKREVNDAGRVMSRVLAVIDGQAQELHGILRSWAYWTALYDHIAQPSHEFRQEELSSEAIAVAGIDWLVLLDDQGALVDVVERSPAPERSVLREQVQASQARLANLFSRIAERTGCGALRVEDRLALMCRSPAQDSSGGGTPRGVVAVGRWIDAEMEATVSRQVALITTIRASTPSPDTGSRSGETLESVLGRGQMTLERTREWLLLRFPITGLLDTPVGVVQVEAPRTLAASDASQLQRTQLVVVLVILCAGALLFWQIDRRVIRRLEQLRGSMAAVMADPALEGRVRIEGKDELAELSRFIDALLGTARDHLRELRVLSSTDALTGLPNRRAFQQRVDQLLAHQTRHGTPATLVLLDVDHFKRYNDTQGHPAGDAALQRIADVLRAACRRATDLPARLGGEEFALLLNDCSLAGGLAYAEDIRTRVEALTLSHGDESRMLTVSAGAAELTPGQNAQTWYARADAALYRAKDGGRNRVTAAD